MSINRQYEALVPHVRMMTLFPVVLLSLLQGSVTTTTIKTILPQKLLKARYDCPATSNITTASSGFIPCANYIIKYVYGGFSYDMVGGICILVKRNSYGKDPCWRIVPQNSGSDAWWRSAMKKGSNINDSSSFYLSLIHFARPRQVPRFCCTIDNFVNCLRWSYFNSRSRRFEKLVHPELNDPDVSNFFLQSFFFHASSHWTSKYSVYKSVLLITLYLSLFKQ